MSRRRPPGTNTYLYDAEDRLCAVHGADGMIGYQYDAEGNRISKGSITTWSCDITANGFQPQSDSILDQSGDQVTEMAVSATGLNSGPAVWLHTNVWADGQLITTFDTAGQHFYFNDPLGTRRYQTDAAGIFEQTCQSLPYGDSLNCSLSTSAPTEHHFTGKERDPESGLDFFMARYYASNLGRFMSPDWSVKVEPIPYGKLDDPQSLNLYQYLLSSPLDGVDADGHVAPNISCGKKGCPKVTVKEEQQYIKDSLVGAVKGLGQAAWSILSMNANEKALEWGLSVRVPSELKALQYTNTDQAVAGFISPFLIPEIGGEAEGAVLLSKAERLAANRLAGMAGEAKVAQELLSEGYKILGTHVGVRTEEGTLRIIDILIEDATGRISAVEVKTGGAGRSAAQLAKDESIATKGGRLIGKNAPKELKGLPRKIQTVVRSPTK